MEKAIAWGSMNYFDRRFLTQMVFSLFMSTVLFFVWFSQASVAEEITLSSVPPNGGMKAQPGYVYSFPYDHGSHDQFSLEWWYLTGHLSSESGQRFGYDLTFFRKAMDIAGVQKRSSRWAMRHLYFAHLALTDVETQTFRFAEKLSRAGLGKAGAKANQMHVWIDRWSLSPVTPDHKVIALKASDKNFALDFKLTLEKPPVIHGKEGISRKGTREGQASHYYSLTRLRTNGHITLENESIDVSGLSWMDHEFGSGELGDDQVGWDWFSLQFDSKIELMVYLLRKEDGSPDPASSGTLIFPDGRSQHLSLQDIRLQTQGYWTSPHTKARYPAKWVLGIPSAQIQVEVKPVLADQELRTSKSTQVNYWEGAVQASGQHLGDYIQGQGYVELTGYTEALKFDRK